MSFSVKFAKIRVIKYTSFVNDSCFWVKSGDQGGHLTLTVLWLGFKRA